MGIPEPLTRLVPMTAEQGAARPKTKSKPGLKNVEAVLRRAGAAMKDVAQRRTCGWARASLAGPWGSFYDENRDRSQRDFGIFRIRR